MAELPRYRQVGIEPIQPRQTARPDLQESVARSNMINQEIGQMTQFLDQKIGLQKQKELQALDIQRTTEGQQIVSQIGDEAVLEQLTAQGGPKNISDRAAYALANQVAADRIEGEATIEMDRIRNQAWLDKVPYNMVNSQLQDVVDGFSASLSNLDPAISSRLRQRLSSTAARYDSDYLSKYANLQQDNEAVTIYNVQLITTRDLAFNVRREGLTEDLQEAVDHQIDVINLYNMNQSEKDKLINNLINTVAKEDIRYLVSLESPMTRQGIIDTYKDQGIGTLNVDQTDDFINELTIENKISISRIRDEYGVLLEDNLNYAMNNPGAPLVALDDRFNLLTENEQQIIVNQRSVIGQIPNLITKSNVEIDDLLRLAENALDAGGDENYTENFSNYNALKTIATNIQNDRKADPTTNAINRNENVKLASESFITAINDGNPNSGDLLTDYIRTQNEFYNSIGTPMDERAVFTNPQVAYFIDVLNNSDDPNQKRNMIDILTSTKNDEYKVLIINQLEDAGTKMGVIRSLELPKSMEQRTGLEILFLAADNLDPNDLPDSMFTGGIKNKTDFKTEITLNPIVLNWRNAMASGNESYDSERFNQMIDLAINVIHVKHINNSTISLETLINKTIPQVFNEKIVGDSIIPFDVPLNEMQIERVYNYLLSEAVINEIPFDVIPLGFSADIDLNTFRTSITDGTNGSFITNQTGDGVVLAYRNQDTQGLIPLTRDDGSFIEYKFTELPLLFDTAQRKSVAEAELAYGTTAFIIEGSRKEREEEGGGLTKYNTNTVALPQEAIPEVDIPEQSRKVAITNSITMAESSNNPDALWKNVQNNKFDFTATESTLEEVLEFTKIGGAYAEWSKDQSDTGTIHTPIGKYQFVGATLRDIKNRGGFDELNIDDSTVFTEEVQDKLFAWYIKDTINSTGPNSTLEAKRNKIRGRFEGATIENVSDNELNLIIDQVLTNSYIKR